MRSTLHEGGIFTYSAKDCLLKENIHLPYNTIMIYILFGDLQNPSFETNKYITWSRITSSCGQVQFDRFCTKTVVTP